MIVLGFLLGLSIILQVFILIGTCRKNYKLDMIEAEVSKLCDVVIPAIGANMKNYAHVCDLLKIIDMEISVEKKHKKKKDKIYDGNAIIKTEKKGAKILL